jgi:hypothetical protein
LLGPIDRQALVPEIARKQACRLSASGLSTADDAASLEIGDRQVPDQTERGSCFHVGAVLSTDADDTLEFVPTQAHVACPQTTAAPGLRW